MAAEFDYVNEEQIVEDPALAQPRVVGDKPHWRQLPPRPESVPWSKPDDENLIDPFIGDTKASREIKHESARHRLCVYLKAEGHTNKEIAEKLEYQPETVNLILKQPWAKNRLQKEIRDAGQAEIKKLLSTVGMASLERLRALAESEEFKILNPKIYYDANVNLVDRFLGKPNQPVTTEHKTSKALTDEELAARIDERLRANSPN